MEAGNLYFTCIRICPFIYSLKCTTIVCLTHIHDQSQNEIFQCSLDTTHIHPNFIGSDLFSSLSLLMVSPSDNHSGLIQKCLRITVLEHWKCVVEFSMRPNVFTAGWADVCCARRPLKAVAACPAAVGRM